MMESSEQCAYDGSLDPDDSSSGTERIVVTSYEDYAREVIPLNQGDDDQESEVLGYLDEENATLVLQSQGIELDGKRLILAQGTGEEAIIVLLSSEQDPSIEHSLEQSISENSDDNHTLAIPCGSDNLEVSEDTEGKVVIETEDDLQNMDKNGTVYVEQTHELTYVDSDNNHYSSEALGYHVQKKNDTTEMVFIPTSSRVISTSNNTRLLHLADVAHNEWATSELQVKEIECSRKISEASVIVSQMHADSIKAGNVSISDVNEQDSNNSIHDAHMTSENETSPPAGEENVSLSLPPRDIDNAVSVIHVTSSTLVHDQDWRTKNISENENQTEETDHLNVTLHEPSTNASSPESSNLKETQDSELSYQSPLTEETSNHSHLKDSTDSSNKDDNVSYMTPATVEEQMDEDPNESSNFPSQLPVSENIDENDLKEREKISCIDNNSNTSMDNDESLNPDNKSSEPSAKNCENETDFANSEEGCSEVEASRKRTYLSLRDNSESKSSFSSDNSQSKDYNVHKLRKLKSISSHKVKKIDEYEFENSSSNLDQELSHNSSLDDQPSDKVNSDDISIEADAAKVSQSANSDADVVTGNLTFQGALIPVTDNSKLDENVIDTKNDETYYDNSQDLFDHGSEDEEENSSSTMLKRTKAKVFKNKQNLTSTETNHLDQDKSSDEKISAMKNGVDIDKENDSVSMIASSGETTVKPLQAQRTYIRKRKIASNRDIELFSLDDDISDPKDETSSYLTPKNFCSDDQTDQIMNDQNNLVDEDGYVNLLPSNVENRIKAKGTSPIEERRTRSLRPRSSDHHEKISDPSIDAEDSVSTCWGAYLMETSFKPTNTEKTEGVTSKVSSPDVSKVESPKSSLKKRLPTKKISAKSDSQKSGQQFDKLIKSSLKIKDASSDVRKVREKIRKQVQKNLRKFENYNSSSISTLQRKKGRPSKDFKKNKTIIHSPCPSHEKVKVCGIRFLNDNSMNSSTMDDPSTPSTSTQNLKSFQYTCSYCNFVSNKVNNLIMHLKYCTLKSPPESLDYGVNDMERRLRIRGDFTETDSSVRKSSTSQNFSNGSVIDDDNGLEHSSSSYQEGLSQENCEESDDEEEDDNEEEPTQSSIQDFRYSENDIVWATINNRFWPALVYKIKKDEVVIYIIDRPNTEGKGVTNVCKKLRIESLESQLHSFDDKDRNKRLLEEAENLPYKDLFIKAVQKAESYIRKRYIYNVILDGTKFFEIHEKFELYNPGDDMIEENLNNEDDEESVDIKALMECIFKRKCDQHVIDVYKEVVTSRRHELHSLKKFDKDAARQLKHMSWFGPFKEHSQLQIRLHGHFFELFNEKFETREDVISYIYEVWIPEGIIKAISIVKGVSLLEAQIIFYKQDVTCVDVGDFPLDDDDDDDDL